MKKPPPRATSRPLPEQHGLFDLLIFVGRFQPFHLGHQAVITTALAQAKHVLVLIGSANAARNPRNPFSYAEREHFVRRVIADERLTIRPIGDHLYNDPAWIAEIQEHVANLSAKLPTRPAHIGIIGHSKDNSSYYLNIFPGYAVVNVPAVTSTQGELINGTDLRNILLNDGPTSHDTPTLGAIPKPIQTEIARLIETPPLKAVIEEHRFAQNYRAKWATAPFPPTFMTVDAVVQQSGHILMVIRKEQPGQGMLALPGGFLQQNETLLDGALRELHEETQIDVPRRVLLGAQRGEKTFDDPHRSIRGRTITHAFRFDLAEKRLPKVKGGDDAESARWVPLSQIRPDACYEDHAHIIRTMLGLS